MKLLVSRGRGKQREIYSGATMNCALGYNARILEHFICLGNAKVINFFSLPFSKWKEEDRQAIYHLPRAKENIITLADFSFSTFIIHSVAYLECMQFPGRRAGEQTWPRERSISAKQIARPRERTKARCCITSSFKNRGGKIQPGHPLAFERWLVEEETCRSQQSQS